MMRRRMNADFNNPDVAREWLKRSNLYDPTAAPLANEANADTPPKHSIFDLLDKSHALIANKGRDHRYLENKAREEGLDLARLQNLSNLDRGMSEKIYDVPKLMNTKGVKTFKDESEANQELYNSYYNQNSWAYDDQVAINKEQGKNELVNSIYGRLGISPSKLDINDFANMTQQQYIMNATNQGQLDSYISRLAALQGQYDTQKLNITDLNNQKAQLEQHYQGALNEKLRLESELIEARNQLKQNPQSISSQERVNELQRALSSSQLSMAQLQNNLTDMQSGLASKDNEINSYKSYIDRLTGERDSIQRVLGQTQSQMDSIRAREQAVEQQRLKKEREDRELYERQADAARRKAEWEAEEARKAEITRQAIIKDMQGAGWVHISGTSFIANRPILYQGRWYQTNSTYTR